MKKCYELVEKNKQLVLDAERYIWANPEPGYKEFKTNAYMLEQFRKLGYTDIVEAKDCTGFYTVVDTGREGPTVLVMSELDSLINRLHPDCDKETGAVHNCGQLGNTNACNNASSTNRTRSDTNLNTISTTVS